jgi:8-amino-7-oxononanoate synthase
MTPSELVFSNGAARMNPANLPDTPPTGDPYSQNLVQHVRAWASQPQRRAFTFLADGSNEAGHWTYGQLDQRARALAGLLQERLSPGETVLLLYPPGLDYIAAFLGCLYAGMLAVPGYPVRTNRLARRVAAMAADSRARLALTTRPEHGAMQPALAQDSTLSALSWLTTDDLADHWAEEWCEPDLMPDTPAFLQYTSGSTTSPRGVQVTHGNLMHNSAQIHRLLGHSPDKCGVQWLPPYHDLGLIGGIVQTVYSGGWCIFMPPLAFLQDPYLWLRAISRYGAYTSGAPNFAYDLCVRRVSAEQKATLDLSCWRAACSGAEPVRAETLRRFAKAFAPCGFQAGAFYPTYGLAEATLLVSGGAVAAAPAFLSLDAEALGHNRVEVVDPKEAKAQTLVGCGRCMPDQKIAIVDPERLSRSPSGRVGEVWVAGPSVAQGYWAQPAESARTFQAFLADTGEGPFLRTGDLGFLHDGELFITGRLKDLLIFHGRNHYPQDIEQTVECCHPRLRPNGGAAFSVDVEGEERLVIAHEVSLPCGDEERAVVVTAIRRAVAAEHDLHVYAVVLLRPNGLSRTSSLKTQRHACRAGFLEGSLPVVGTSIVGPLAWTEETAQPDTLQAGAPGMAESPPGKNRMASVLEELTTRLADELGNSPTQVDVNEPLNTLGLDSLTAVGLHGIIQRNYGVTIPLEQFIQDVTLREVASLIVRGQESSSGATSPSPDGAGHSAAAPDRQRREEQLRQVHKPVRHVLQRAREFEMLDQLRATGLMPYFRELDRNEGTTCLYQGRSVLMFGSNNYLGLTTDPRVRAAAARAALEEGPSLTGSRLLNGSTTRQREFERKLATFLGREDALVFTTGYQAILGVMTALLNGETTAILDQLCHASIVDGAFMSRCPILSFRHNNLAHLERRLQEVTGKSAAMVVVDGVYSMAGDVAPLLELKGLCDRYDACLVVDDAHGLGMLGSTGKGTEEHFNLTGKVDLVCGTFSKSLASIGGWVAGETKVIDWIRFHGRSMLFSAAIPPTSLAAASAALDVLITEPWRVERLNDNARYWRAGLQRLGFNTGTSTTAIAPILLGDDLRCLQFGKTLLDAGVYVNPVIYPAVPRGAAVLRSSVMATHERHQLDQALEVLGRVGKSLGILPREEPWRHR